jgi:uncharacterized protein
VEARLFKNTPMTKIVHCIALCYAFSACNSTVNKIEVTGHASMKVVPDMVELSLKTYNVRPAMKDAVKETQLVINDILTVCHKYIPDEQDIKVSSVATDKAYDYTGNREVFKGYSALQILQVTLKDISKLEKFTEELLSTKITTIGGVRYNHTKADSLQRVVNLMALSDAKITAEKMCDKMNVRLGNILFMSNFQPSDQQRADDGRMSYDVNVYSKSFGGRGFMMTTEILQFDNVAFAGFQITP